ncbi:hypothetical protein MTR67_030833 [Solanum verrucosum]|uniref:Uncharacterized protein n=1 Tax=Solanum verrucosum TaxID=315347 RepID=A0AAF0U1C3_SOLVR|nr:hypothetical protein MTR67_030833 [Solanum verrucosum]
MIWSWLQLYLH